MRNKKRVSDSEYVSLFKYNLRNDKIFTKDIWADYCSGEIIESFVILQTILELDLNLIWSAFQEQKNKKRKSTHKGYHCLVELLSDKKIIDKKLQDELYCFKKGRNSVVHQFGKQDVQFGIAKKELDNQFKIGLKAYKKIWKIYDGWTSVKIEFHGKKIA